LGFVKGFASSGRNGHLDANLQAVAEDKMIKEADALGAKYIISVRYAVSFSSNYASSEIMAYGTAATDLF